MIRASRSLVVTLLWASVAITEEPRHFPVYSCFATQIPVVDPDTQAIVQTHLYLACIDVKRRQPVWVAYKLRRADHDTENILSRNFHTPRKYRDICLEQSDYAESGYDLGHLIPLASFSASPFASEVNSLVVIAAQRPGLNRGPWLKVEELLRDASLSTDVMVLAGCLWLDDAKRVLPNSDEPHSLPSHFWMLANWAGLQKAWLIPQSADIGDSEQEYQIEPAELKSRISVKWWNTQ